MNVIKTLLKFCGFFLQFITSICLLVGIFVLVTYIQNTTVKVTELTFTSEKLPTSFNGYKIIHLSDIHNDYYGGNESKIINKVEQENPDIIVITGDIVDSNRYELNKIIPLLTNLQEIAPIYYVYGNHDGILDLEENQECVEAMNSIGAICMNLKNTKIFKGNDYINLLGIPDLTTTDKYDSIRNIAYQEDKMRYMIEEVSSNVDSKNNFTILLSHRPEYTPLYQSYDLDLVLTGHAHGGQVRIPFVGGLYAPHQGFLPKYTSGVHTNNNTSVVVSRGLGNSTMPIRVFNTPEIISITLKSA